MNNLPKNNLKPQGEIIIFKTKDGTPDLSVKMEKETIWLTQQQVAQIFDVQKAAISKHVRNIFNSGELEKSSTVSILETVQKEGKRGVSRKIEYYNLDLILSIGYRVNSKRATQFRIWATNILKSHIIEGYTINEKRLKENKELKLNELQKAIDFLQRVMNHRQLKSHESQGLLQVITDYANSWIILQKYDERKLETMKKG
jgi:hypothetical protein